MRAAVLYWSKTGNTEKVALAVREALEAAGADVLLKRTDEAADVDFFAYDLVVVGFPSYQWRPPKPVEDFLSGKMSAYRKEDRVKIAAPRVPGRNAVVFCTYSGPHTGINEAIPATKTAGQYFDHLGFEVRAEWHVVGEFHGREEMSTSGRLGDIRGRPNAEDLAQVKRNVTELVGRL